MKTLYLDMDGVVADFDEYSARTLGVPPSAGIYPDEIWYKLASNARLYRDLIPTTYANQLVYQCEQFCNKKHYDLKFLSAVPKGNDVPWAFYDKVYWARHHFEPVFCAMGNTSVHGPRPCEGGT